jgi:CYTH domain-containing protein
MKYAVDEIERRWLVDKQALGPLEALPVRDIEDLYLVHSRLRLRKIVRDVRATEYKLCKKYGRGSGLAEPVSNLYLSQQEFELLAALSGHRVRKRRNAVAGGAVDVYAGEAGLAIFEIEFATEREAANDQPPAFVLREVTQDPLYSGAALAAQHS